MSGTQSMAMKESRRHGSDAFPMGVYEMNLLPGVTVLDCHWHEEAEFLYVMEGETNFRIGSSVFPLRAGEAVFVHSGDIHAGDARGDAGCRFAAVVFDFEWLCSAGFDLLQQDYLMPIIDGRKSLPSHITPATEWERRILHELKQMLNVLKDRPNGFPLAVKSRMYSILFEIAAGDHWVSKARTADRDQADLDRLKQVLRYIETHYERKIELSELARISHMSEGHFCRFFKAMTRKTSMEYINGYRIQRAADMLKFSQRKISDIAQSVGFDNFSYFSKTFKTHTGRTPASYRKHYRNM